MTITLHQGDLPSGLDFGSSVAVDTETLGLNPHRDRLCLVQLSAGDGTAHIVRFEKDQYDAPHLSALLSNTKITKLFHYARFDIAVIRKYLGVECTPLYCTRTASKLARTYTDRHGLRDICRELLGVELNKQQQSSNWAAAELSEEQLKYAANDVFYLHELKQQLDVMLKGVGRTKLAQDCFDFLPVRAALDLEGWPDIDIFEH